ncbi:MAG TPA: BCAM0308 family protein [Burkholderiaceae bacterium]|nr:BCAM0308 family protein [Burkholderiaceae bacterium]
MKATRSPPSATLPGRYLDLPDNAAHDPYQEREKLSEPTLCGDCGAVYRDGRWQWLAPPANAARTRCAACHRIADRLPAGYLAIEGLFAHEHRDELLSLARNVEAREKSEHPLQRIMAVDEQDDGKLMITTTDIHLARGLGEALRRAYKGELNFHYNKGEYLLRVRWER